MNHEAFRLWTGVFLSLVFSAFFLWLIVRAIYKGGPLPIKNLGVLALGMFASVVLVGDAPYVSLLQSVIISLGCLHALHQHITKGEPDPKVVAVLATAMLASLVVNQASGPWKIGLIDWFSNDSTEQSEEAAIEQTEYLLDEVAKLRDHLDHRVGALEQDAGSLVNTLTDLDTRWDQTSAVSRRVTRLLSERGGEVLVVSPQEPQKVEHVEDVTVEVGKRRQFLLPHYEAIVLHQRGGFFTDEKYTLVIIDIRDASRLVERSFSVGEVYELDLGIPGQTASRFRIDIVDKTPSNYKLRVYRLVAPTA